tara:strand:- start:143 stop:559 length:417 start_codon:yes stop_codon:yes gene_type:complete
MWFNILKTSQQISSTGIRTKLGSTPLTMGDENDVDCCEIARGWIKGWTDVNVGKGHFETHEFTEGGTLAEMDCDRLYFMIKKWSEFFWRPNPADRNFARNWAKDIIKKWDQCEDDPSNFTSDGIMTYHGNMSDTIVGE